MGKNTFSKSILSKILIIVCIMIVLLLPTFQIRQLIDNRIETQDTVAQEICSKWGESQTIRGPFLSIPYVEKGKQSDAENGSITILPNKLDIKGNINPETRYRGVYEIVVYSSEFNISGTFTDMDKVPIDRNKYDLLYDKAVFVIGINDLRGIEKLNDLDWNGQKLAFKSGKGYEGSGNSGVIAYAKFDPTIGSISFNTNVVLKGSKYLYFTPVGSKTDVNITSTWNNPSFNGTFLPDKREISSNGFTANWNILQLNRSFPQVWLNNDYSMNETDFGIDLLIPIDNYLKTHRSIRYSILFIGFTFLVLFIIEMLYKMNIHPVHYILVGAALVIFYTLLLSISEYISFNFAFALSSLLTISLIGGYLRTLLKSNRYALLISMLLIVMYALIFTMIQVQEFALIMGSIGLFIILAIVMYFSNKITWNKQEQPEANDFEYED
jgi:inner membrane protein